MGAKEFRGVHQMRALGILYHPSSLWPYGGSERRFVNVAKELRKYGIEFDVIETCPSLSLYLKTDYNSYCVKLFSRNALYIDIIEWILRGFKKSWYLMRNKERLRYEFVYVANNNLYNLLLGYLVGRLYSLPLIVVVHHLRWIDYEYSRQREQGVLFSAYRKMRREGVGRLHALVQAFGAIFEASLLRKFDYYIAVSYSAAKELMMLALPNEKIFVSGNGISFSNLNSFNFREKKYDAVYVGRFDEGKGVYELIRIWKEVTKSLPEAKLLMLGSGMLRREATNLVEKLGLSLNVFMPGFVPEKILYQLLCGSKIFVTASRTEGFSLAVAEALACGVPVVCYDIPALRENYGKCPSVFLVPRGDSETFARRVVDLLSLEPQKYRILSEISRTCVRCFDWSLVAKREFLAISKALCTKFQEKA
jgi:glycosyltransferase involved in cell wall biosynthesis